MTGVPRRERTLGNFGAGAADGNTAVSARGVGRQDWNSISLNAAAADTSSSGRSSSEGDSARANLSVDEGRLGGEARLRFVWRPSVDDGELADSFKAVECTYNSFSISSVGLRRFFRYDCLCSWAGNTGLDDELSRALCLPVFGTPGWLSATALLPSLRFSGSATGSGRLRLDFLNMLQVVRARSIQTEPHRKLARRIAVGPTSSLSYV